MFVILEFVIWTFDRLFEKDGRLPRGIAAVSPDRLLFTSTAEVAGRQGPGSTIAAFVLGPLGCVGGKRPALF